MATSGNVCKVYAIERTKKPFGLSDRYLFRRGRNSNFPLLLPSQLPKKKIYFEADESEKRERGGRETKKKYVCVRFFLVFTNE